MVRTSKGPAEKSEPKQAHEKGEKTAADKAQSDRPSDIDDATWGQIESMARSQRTTPGEVIKRAIVAQFGVAQPQGAYHSGMDTDPTKG